MVYENLCYLDSTVFFSKNPRTFPIPSSSRGKHQKSLYTLTPHTPSWSMAVSCLFLLQFLWIIKKLDCTELRLRRNTEKEQGATGLPRVVCRGGQGRERQRHWGKEGERELTGSAIAFWNLKTHPISSNKATPPNPSQIVQLTGTQTFKYMSLWGYSHSKLAGCFPQTLSLFILA